MAKKTSKLSSMVAKAVPVKIVSDTAINKSYPSAEDEKRERKWRAEEDIRTMQRAAEIKADKERVKAMKEHATEQIKALKNCT